MLDLGNRGSAFLHLLENKTMHEVFSRFLGRAFLGFNVRVPTSLREFCLPPEQRLYKPGQG